MDFSWLGGIFQAAVNLLKPLTQISHWKIWAAIWDMIQRFRNWYKWYQQNVQKQIQAARARFNKVYDQFVLPILKIVDLIRRITGAVGIVNSRLAAKLNAMFLRVESYLLKPLNDVNAKLNQMARIFDGFLTPLGYLDRATLLNSLWRDIGQLKQLLVNPLGTTQPQLPIPPAAPASAGVSLVQQTIDGQQTPIADSVNASVLKIRTNLGV